MSSTVENVMMVEKFEFFLLLGVLPSCFPWCGFAAERDQGHRIWCTCFAPVVTFLARYTSRASQCEQLGGWREGADLTF